MRNPIIDTAAFGPVYKRKIHIYFKNELTKGLYHYGYGSNAYPTCKAAKRAALANFPSSEVKASFAQ